MKGCGKVSEIDSLEIRVEASAKSANRTLDEMSKKLDDVAESMKKVLSLSNGLKNIGKIDSNEIKNVKKQLDSLEKSIKKPSKKQVKAKVDDKEIKKATQSLDDLFEKFSKAGTGLDVSKLGFQDLVKSSKKADSEVQRLNDRLEKKISVDGTDNLGKSWENLVFDIQKATNQAEIYREAVSKIKNKVPEFSIARGEDTKKVTKTDNPKVAEVDSSSLGYNSEAMKFTFGEETESLKNFNEVLERFGGNASEASRKINSFEEAIDTNKIQTYSQQIKKAKQELAELAKQGFREGDSDYDEKAKELALLTERQKNYNRINRESAKSTIKKEQTSNWGKLSSSIKRTTDQTRRFLTPFKKVTDSLRKSESAIRNPIKLFGKLKNAIAGVQNHSNKGMSLGKMVGSSILFSTVFQGISMVKQAIAEGSNNLVRYSTEYNKSISSMVSSLLYLKNSWAAAFSPIINVVAPYVSAFIDLISGALNKVGQFFSALTGKSFAVQAAKPFKDYGASLKDVGNGAKNAAKGLDKAKKSAKDFQTYTLGIDELNVAPQKDKKDKETSTSPSGGSPGGSGAGEILPSEMFTTTEIESGVSEFAKKVKEAWSKADFTEIGAIIGSKLKGALESIPWGPIQETAGKIGKSLGTLITGFVEVEGLGYKIGYTIGQAINTGVIGISNFLDNTNWESVGAFLGDGLNGVVATVDFKGVGHLIAQEWNAVFEVIGEAARTFNWAKLGKELANGLNKAISDFNWSENGKSLGDIIKGLLDTLIEFLENTDWQKLGDSISDFIGSIDWTGIVLRIAEGIGAAIGGLSALLWGLIKDSWSSVVAWWKETAYEDGKFTITGLLQGIVDVIFNIGSWIKNNIFQPFIDGFKKAFGIHSPSTVMAEQGIYIMQGLFDGVKEMFGKVVGFFVGLWSGIKDVFKGVKGWFETKFKDAYTAVTEAFKGINTWFSEKWKTVKEIFGLGDDNKASDFFSKKFTGAYTAVTEAWDGIKGWFQDRWKEVKEIFGLGDDNKASDFFSKKFTGAYTAVTEAFKGIKGFFSKVAGWIITPIDTAVNGVINGINWVFDKVSGKKPLKNWTPPKFEKGSNGLPSDTIGVVNDQAGSTYKELIVPPHGKPFIPEGRNVMLPMAKGTKIMPAGQTKALMDGMPKFKNGIGEFFGNTWSKIKDFTGDVLDYLEKPSKILQIAIDKFTDFSGLSKFFIPLATGAVNKVFDSAVKYIGKMFEKTGYAGIDKAIKWAVGIANDNRHGYDQKHRTGPDYDCSSLVTTALKKAGFNIPIGTTSTMYGSLTSAGFKNVTSSVSVGSGNGMKKGDVLLKPGEHTAMYIGDKRIVHASINELGKTLGGKTGDQTGKEICTKGYYNYPWTYVLRYAKKYKKGIGEIGITDLIPKYSVGGFPEDGLFMANRNELVGKFSDGRTAVANNLNIQKGIEDAAYRGFSRANAENREQENLLRELIEAVKDGKRIVVDGRELVSITDSRRARNGYSFI